MSKVITAVNLSKNAKTGPVSATYAPIQSCPDSCPLKDNGCYAQGGNCGFTFRRVSNNAENMNVHEIALHEAQAIDNLDGLLPLRLHVTGDCTTDKAAQTVSQACKRYTERSGQPVWAYTHAWQGVNRESWGSVAVTASCETTEQVKLARSKGYKTALVTPLDRLADKVKACSENKLKPIICRNFVEKIPCTKCRKCWTDDKDVCILLPTHGSRSKTVDKVVKDLE